MYTHIFFKEVTPISDQNPFNASDDASASRASAQQTVLQLIDLLLLEVVEEGPRLVLGRLREQVLSADLQAQATTTELKKLTEVVKKVTSPANRIGTLLSLPTKTTAHIVVGGAEYYANIDPRLEESELEVGMQILVNEAFTVLKTLDYDKSGALMKISDLLSDGRIRVAQETGANSTLLIRAAMLKDEKLKVGDEVRTDASHRVAVERVEASQKKNYFLEESPTTTWDDIGGQKEAIKSIRDTLEQPLLYPELYQRFQYSQPKGFLLYGPPGCGKTLIGKATAAGIVKQLQKEKKEKVEEYFLHIKGPEILNMWLGESERMVRDIFAQAREKANSGYLPVVFIDEAESILGTRRSSRTQNILSTLVPMFCAEMDGVASLKEMVIILASNRPDLIDPAILRPGRIDRKIKVGRPDKASTRDIFAIYLSEKLPIAQDLVDEAQGDLEKARQILIECCTEALFQDNAENKMIEVRLRSNRREILYRKDLVNGAIIASIVERAKETAIKRAIAGEAEGLRKNDLLDALSAEYKEGEILPPTGILEDWLTLIDHDPKNVVGISLLNEEKRSNGIQKSII
ncbi:MAG: AAA family ATPase [Nitrospirae bacterium]|nr:AAA family ATPase [Candidatus Manganitrophaceae bacterium]